jgi:very-short-patch-repair endonuclease
MISVAMENKTLNYRKALRKNPTVAEKCLWQHLRRRQMFEHKFRRQHPVGPYIVDFICLEKKLVVEVDGGQHLDQEAYDERRSRFLQEKGYRVLRFWNNQVLQQIQTVLRAIEFALGATVEPSGSQSQKKEGAPILDPSPTDES